MKKLLPLIALIPTASFAVGIGSYEALGHGGASIFEVVFFLLCGVFLFVLVNLIPCLIINAIGEKIKEKTNRQISFLGWCFISIAAFSGWLYGLYELFAIINPVKLAGWVVGLSTTALVIYIWWCCKCDAIKKSGSTTKEYLLHCVYLFSIFIIAFMITHIFRVYISEVIPRNQPFFFTFTAIAISVRFPRAFLSDIVQTIPFLISGAIVYLCLRKKYSTEKVLWIIVLVQLIVGLLFACSSYEFKPRNHTTVVAQPQQPAYVAPKPTPKTVTPKAPVLTKTQKIVEDLNKKLPYWAEQNEDTGFLDWLAKNNYKRQDELDKAFNDGDSETIIVIFTDYRYELLFDYLDAHLPNWNIQLEDPTFRKWAKGIAYTGGDTREHYMEEGINKLKPEMVEEYLLLYRKLSGKTYE